MISQRFLLKILDIYRTDKIYKVKKKMVSPNDCSMGARIGFSVLGVVLGLAVTIVFAAEYHNFSASVWAFASGKLTCSSRSWKFTGLEHCFRRSQGRKRILEDAQLTAPEY